jgi:hypothetical protein
LGKLGRSFIVDAFEMFGLTAIVLGTDIDREKTILATAVDEAFGLVEVAFAKTVLLEDVAPAA